MCLLRFSLWVGKTLWKRKWQHTPVPRPEKSHGQSLVGYSPWSHKRVGHDLLIKQHHHFEGKHELHMMSVRSNFLILATL